MTEAVTASTSSRLPGAPVIADEGGPMTNGGNHDGVIEVGDLDLWTFSGQSGDKIVLRSGRLSGDPNFNPWLRLYDQSGVVVASTATATAVSAVEISLTLTNTGTFTLLIADSTSAGPTTKVSIDCSSPVFPVP
jgi:hypothetical protein